MPSAKGKSRGDLMVRANVVLPRNLTNRERELFRELEQLRKDLSSKDAS